MPRASVELKSKKSEELLGILGRHGTIALVDTYRVKTALLNRLRDIYRGEVLFKYVKNSTLSFSAKMAKNEKLLTFIEKYGRGTVLLVLSNKEPYELQQSFGKNSIELNLKSGDVVNSDVSVPAGNTGLPPGPIISELNAVGILTKIESGSVWVTKDVIVAKVGDHVSPQLASALSKLNIKPVRAFLRIAGALVDNIIVSGELLETTSEELQKTVLSAVNDSAFLSASIGYTTPENLPALISRANVATLILALAVSFPTPQSISSILVDAKTESMLVQTKLDKSS